METEYGVVYDSGQRQIVEQLCEVDPDVWVSVLAKALVVEAVDLSNLAHLVVSS